MKKPTGVILYEGASLCDSQPIVIIATGIQSASSNEKTGAMVQTWILRQDIEPHQAIKTGDDKSICGACPHRPINGGACYVQVHNAPLSVYRAYKRGNYPHLSELESNPLDGRIVRLGAYGDPAMVPVSVWDKALAGAAAWTGYTHQWHWCNPGMARYCMASADSPSDLVLAQAAGYRTFRIRTPEEPLQAKESICPASAEAGKKLNCASCKACGGTAKGRKGSIGIIVHGAKAKRYLNQRNESALTVAA